MKDEDEKRTEVATQQESGTELALSPQEEARALLDEASQGAHALLKFKEGIFHIRGEEVPLGTRYYAYPANWERQWLRFDDGKLTKKIRVRVATKKLLSARSKLSDPHLEGSDKDPWSLHNVVPFENVETGQLVTFTTQTVGGKIGIDEMVAAYSKAVLKGTARGLPIIELRVLSFRSGYQKDVQRPDFPIVDWENPATSAEPTIIPPQAKQQHHVHHDAHHHDADDEVSSPVQEDMENKIPF
jgi:hypothetical protein